MLPTSTWLVRAAAACSVFELTYAGRRYHPPWGEDPFATMSVEEWEGKCTEHRVGSFELTSQPIQFGAAAHHHALLPKLSAMNSTAWEQWIFDATADDGTRGIMVALCRDPNYAFFGQGNLHVQLFADVGGGKPIIDLVFLERSSLFDCGDYMAGYWASAEKDYEFLFTVHPNLDAAALRIATPRLRGNLTFMGAVPGHYPDGSPMLPPSGSSVPDTDGAAFAAPGLYMSNAVAGARVASVLELNGTPLAPPFQVRGGAGMMRLWASRSWFEIVAGFRIIRAYAGPYSFFFWDSGSRWDKGALHTWGVLYRGAEQLVATRRREAITEMTGPESSAVRPPSSGQDWVQVSQQYGGLGTRGSSVADATSTGHLVEFFSHATNRTWSFEVEHARLYTSMPLGGGRGVDIFSNRVWGGELDSDEDGKLIYAPLYRGSGYSEDALFPRELVR